MEQGSRNGRRKSNPPRAPQCAHNVPDGGQGFYFVTNVPIDIPIQGCTNPTVTFLVPKTDPADVTNTKDNPAYRDSVDALMLAYSQSRSVAIYVDSCVNGYPRVVGLDIL